jgi:hypothetical protein
MDAGLAEHIKKLDIGPNSVLFVNVEKVDKDQLIPLRLPYIGIAVPVVFTVGPPEVNLLTRAELVEALRRLDNDQKGNRKQ